MRRYLANCDKDIEKGYCDVLIVGSGLAGLYTALNVDENLSCVLLSKQETDDSNSYLAQGGIAAVFNNEDSFDSHYQDTLEAGAGLCNAEAVKVLVNEAPQAIKRLMDFGVNFDIDESGVLQITREGGHSRNRILHCGGDATGKEIVKKLTEMVTGKPNLCVKYNSFLTDIVTLDGKVLGAIVYQDGYKLYISNNIVICSGGIGQIYKYTTNPYGATGDGIAAALRAGVKVKDMEFVQFHPTALFDKGDSERLFLISEALRGEGGILKNRKGERFMQGVHPMAELAPRDIVAREINNQIENSNEAYVYLDITHKSKEFLSQRFPTIYNECIKHDIDISDEYIPIRPVQHYFMGGIETDLNGMSNIPGIYACGEAACTGVHGANRLASNSLLECLVFGRRCAQDICQKHAAKNESNGPQNLERDIIGSINLQNGLDLKNKSLKEAIEINEIRSSIKSTMSRSGGIIKKQKKLEAGISSINDLIDILESLNFSTKEQIEVYNMALVAKAVLEAARKRKESIGAHYRED